MDMLSHASRACVSSKVRLLFFPVLSAFVTFNVPKGVAEDNLEHPFIEQNEIKSETCLTCHPGKKEGKFVHTALGTGCQSCHRVTSENDTTTINLVALGGALCAMCHEAKKDQVLHKPYRDGQCLICHNPHAAEYRAQTRASVDSLCLSCHGIGRPDVRVDAKTQTVSLLDGRSYDLASFEQAPKVGGEHAQIRMPSQAGRAALSKASSRADAARNCIACHDPHASEAKHLLHKAAESGRAGENLRPSFLSHRRHANEAQGNMETYQDRFPEGRG